MAPIKRPVLKSLVPRTEAKPPLQTAETTRGRKKKPKRKKGADEGGRQDPPKRVRNKHDPTKESDTLLAVSVALSETAETAKKGAEASSKLVTKAIEKVGKGLVSARQLVASVGNDAVRERGEEMLEAATDALKAWTLADTVATALAKEFHEAIEKAAKWEEMTRAKALAAAAAAAKNVVEGADSEQGKGGVRH